MTKPVLIDQDYNNATKIVNVPDPVDPQDVATKNYVDTAGGGAFPLGLSIALNYNAQLS